MSAAARASRILAVLVATAVLAGGVAGTVVAARPAPRPLPPGFFGVVPQAPLSSAELERMQGTVGTLRLPVYWFEIEAERGIYDFAKTDRAIGNAARHGLEVLPFVYGTPAWLAREHACFPLGSKAGRAAWPRFVRALVERYGPGGEFWRGREWRRPVHRWQIWNEPNFRLFWRPRPSPRQYAELLSSAAAAIRAADPRARVVLAGVAPVGGGTLPWVYLRRLYRVPGVRRDFDAVGLHPYGARVEVMASQIDLARRVMDEAGDERTPILVTELGVASRGAIPSAFVKGPRGQAEFLRRSFALLLDRRRDWGIAGIYWFTWRDWPVPDPHCGFCEGAGLVDLHGRAKPAWAAYKAIARGHRPR
jgi:polysaccharide biosynthesis protein PslG